MSSRLTCAAGRMLVFPLAVSLAVLGACANAGEPSVDADASNCMAVEQGDAGDAAGGQGAVQTIGADEAHEMMTSNEVAVLDVRTPEEYAQEHIVNARLLPLDTIDAAAAAEAAPDKAAPVLVYCRTGVRSAEAVRKLADLGYERVYDFGGICDWPYATIESDADAAECGLGADQLPVGVKVVCGQTKAPPKVD